MTAATVEVDIGAPRRINIKSAVQGSRWRLSTTNWVLLDGLDFTGLTGATFELRHSPGKGDADFLIPVDITQKASMAIFVDSEYGSKLDTSTVPLGLYSCALRFQASGTVLDNWVPLNGLWNVTDRLTP